MLVDGWMAGSRIDDPRTGHFTAAQPGVKIEALLFAAALMASPERIARYRRGRLSEWLAAAVLLGKGYRLLGRRIRTPFGEIDLIALRGRRLAFVEVKR